MISRKLGRAGQFKNSLNVDEHLLIISSWVLLCGPLWAFGLVFEQLDCNSADV